MSGERQARSILRLKRIILGKHRQINELLEEFESQNITKQREEKINIILKDLHMQLCDTEEALVLISR